MRRPRVETTITAAGRADRGTTGQRPELERPGRSSRPAIAAEDAARLEGERARTSSMIRRPTPTATTTTMPSGRARAAGDGCRSRSVALRHPSNRSVAGRYEPETGRSAGAGTRNVSAPGRTRASSQPVPWTSPSIWIGWAGDGLDADVRARAPQARRRRGGRRCRRSSSRPPRAAPIAFRPPRTRTSRRPLAGVDRPTRPEQARDQLAGVRDEDRQARELVPLAIHLDHEP